jgi:iron(III) transport system ATP-binding protein
VSNHQAIALENVSKKLAGRLAVEGVSFSVPSGQCLAILGPTGCGKTTVLRLIAGFEAPDWGKISIDGKTVSLPAKQTPPCERGVGLVFQDLALWPHMSVWQNIGFVLDPKRYDRRERKARIRQSLDRVGLSNRRNAHPHQLSGGEKQRLALARALAPKPSLLLLDEPMSSLDAALKKELLPEVKALIKKTNTTVVYVTHQWREAVYVADRIALMEKRKIYETMTVGSFNDRYRSRFENYERFGQTAHREAADVIPLKRKVM